LDGNGETRGGGSEEGRPEWDDLVWEATTGRPGQLADEEIQVAGKEASLLRCRELIWEG